MPRSSVVGNDEAHFEARLQLHTPGLPPGTLRGLAKPTLIALRRPDRASQQPDALTRTRHARGPPAASGGRGAVADRAEGQAAAAALRRSRAKRLASGLKPLAMR